MSGAIYGGDEVGAIVLDFGEHIVKAGCAGEDSPKCLFPGLAGYIESKSAQNGSIKDGNNNNSSAAMDVDPPTGAAPKGNKQTTKYCIGDNQINFPRSHMELKSPIKNGVIEDWDLFEAMVDHMYDYGLKTTPSEHPVLMAESVWNTRPFRERLTELFFEKYNVPAFFLAKSAVLSTFANGRSTGLVLDCGEGGTTVTPVYDGYALQKSALKSVVGGSYLTRLSRGVLEEQEKIDLCPTFMIKSKEKTEQLNDQKPQYEKHARFVVPTDSEGDKPSGDEEDDDKICRLTKSYYDWAVSNVVRDWQMSVAQVSEVAYDKETIAMIPTVPHEFPTGFQGQFGVSRFEATERMFDVAFHDDSMDTSDGKAKDVSGEGANSKGGANLRKLGLHHLVHQVVDNCDVDIRSSMYANIIVTGGTTLIPGFSDRLYNEVFNLAPPQTKMRILAATGSAERRFSSWIGGSILASLGSFQQLWVSNQEFQESGKSIIVKKCP